ncbi:MAG: alpha/beta hydrolase [Bacteroidota bacterium]
MFCKYKNANKIVVVCLLLLSIACQFRITDEEAISEISQNESSIFFGDLQVADRSMHYAYSGTDKNCLVVFVHGSPGSWNAFIDFFQADSLLKEMDMLAVDRPGYGLSDFGESISSLEKQSHLITEVVKLFKHEQKILVGHSLGGPVIARMAMDDPTQFDGLVMVAPSIDPELEKDEWYRKMIKTRFGGWLTPKEFEVSNQEILTLKDELELMIPFWKKIETPVIVIQGTDDGLVPKENADFASRMINDSLLTIRMLEEINHFIPWSHPQEISDAIYDLKD